AGPLRRGRLLRLQHAALAAAVAGGRRVGPPAAAGPPRARAGSPLAVRSDAERLRPRGRGALAASRRGLVRARAVPGRSRRGNHFGALDLLHRRLGRETAAQSRADGEAPAPIGPPRCFSRALNGENATT